MRVKYVLRWLLKQAAEFREVRPQWESRFFDQSADDTAFSLAGVEYELHGNGVRLVLRQHANEATIPDFISQLIRKRVA